MQKLISIEAWLKLVMGHPIFTGQEMCPTVCILERHIARGNVYVFIIISVTIDQ